MILAIYGEGELYFGVANSFYIHDFAWIEK